jgi:hypothetical protein
MRTKMIDNCTYQIGVKIAVAGKGNGCPSWRWSAENNLRLGSGLFAAIVEVREQTSCHHSIKLSAIACRQA